MKQQYYTKEQLVQLIDQAEDIDKEEIRKLAQRKMLRETIREYKIQDDIIREQYQQSHLYQEKILITYRQLQGLEDPQKVSYNLLSQFDDDYLVVQNTAEQCIEWFYRTDKSEYITVINLIYDQYNEFQESLQKKLIKDVKINHGKAYLVIKYLTPILEEQFLKEVYQYLLLHYCFCYIYDFKGTDNIIKSIYQLTDHKDVESQFMIQVYEQKVVICDQLFQLSKQELIDSIQATRLYLTPKLQFNQNFVERTQKEFDVQQINVVECIKIEIRSAFQIILNNPLLEAFITQIVLNQKDLTKFIIDLLMDKLIIDKQNKILQILINLITHQELKQLYYQNNKKKPLMREILNICIEERFQVGLQNEELLQQTFKIIVDLYKNGLVSKAQLLIYVKLSLKQLFSQIKQEEIKEIDKSSIIKSLNYVQGSIEIVNKIKDHEQYGIEKSIKQLIFQKYFNWFDIDNLIRLDTLATILNVMAVYNM